MDNERFKVSVIGGFNRKDVLDYINHLLDEKAALHQKFDEETDIKSKEISKLKEELTLEKTKMRKLIIQLQNLKNKLKMNEDNYQFILEEKNTHLNELELQNRQLIFKNKKMEERLQAYINIDNEHQNYIHKAEEIARQKTNNIIKQAKEIVEEEYNHRLMQAEEKSSDLVKCAQTQAAEIIENTTNSANEILQKSKQELEEAVAQAQEKSRMIIDRANRKANEIFSDANLKNAEDIAEDIAETEYLDKMKARSLMNLEQMKEKIQREVEEAVAYLDHATHSAKAARNKVAKIHTSKMFTKTDKGRYKQAVQNFFK